MYTGLVPLVLTFVIVLPRIHALGKPSSSSEAQIFHRKLTPVKYPSNGNQQRQANPFTWDHELDLEYVDMGTYNDPQADTFGATVNVDTYNPAVQTEQFNGAVTSIQCSTNDSMTMNFANDELAELAKTTWDVPALTIITYTPSCNDDDERVPWEITKLLFSGSSASMNARKLSWNEAGTTRSLDFGSRGNITNPASQDHSKVKRDINIPLNWNIPAGVNLLKTGVADISVTEKCKACSISGKAVLKSGSFTSKNSGGSKRRREARTLEERSWWSDFTDMFSIANIELDFVGFGGSFLLETEADAEHDFDFHILGEDGVGIPGLQIKNILTIGPRVDPIISGSIGLREPLQLEYGFKFGVPSGAGVTVDLLSPSSSNMHGFDGASFSALPFTTNIKNVTNGAKVGIAFKPTFSFGIDLHGHKFDAVELDMEVPKYSVTTTGMRNVDENCAAGGNHDAVKFEGSFEFDAALKGGGNSSLKFNKQLFDTPGLAPASTCIVFGGSTTPKPSAGSGSGSKPADSGSKSASSASSGSPTTSSTMAVSSGVASAATSSFTVASTLPSTSATFDNTVSSLVPTTPASAFTSGDGAETASTDSDSPTSASLVTLPSVTAQSDASTDPSSVTDPASATGSATDTAGTVETEPTQGSDSTVTANSDSQPTPSADPQLTQPSDPSQTGFSSPSTSGDSDTAPTPTEDPLSSPITDSDPTGTGQPDPSSEDPEDDPESNSTDSPNASPTGDTDPSGSEDAPTSPSETPDSSSSDEPDTSSEGTDDSGDTNNGQDSSDSAGSSGDSNDEQDSSDDTGASDDSSDSNSDAASADDQASDPSTDDGADADQPDDTDADSGTPDESTDASAGDDMSSSTDQDDSADDSSGTSDDDTDTSTDDQDTSTDDDSSDATDDGDNSDATQDGPDAGGDDDTDDSSNDGNTSDDQVPARI